MEIDEKTWEEMQREHRDRARKALAWEELVPLETSGSVGRPKGLDPKTWNKIIQGLANGPMTFSELQHNTGTHRTVLSKHLGILEKGGIVKREVLPRKGHYVQYSMVGRPVTILEYFIMPLLHGRGWKRDIIPYERYMVHTRGMEQVAEAKKEAVKKMSEVIDPDEFFERVQILFPPTGDSKKLKQAYDQAFRYYAEQVRKMEPSWTKIDQTPLVKESREAGLQVYMFIQDMRENRVCAECFRNGNFSLLIQEPESNVGCCPRCGYSVDMIPSGEVSEEGKAIERKQASYGVGLSKEVPLGRMERLGTPSELERQILKALDEAIKKKSDH